MVTYEVHERIANVLDTIEHLYRDVMARIERGEVLSAADIKQLGKLSKMMNAVRNQEVILNPTVPTAVFAKKWGITQARVSQIRTEDGRMRINAMKHRGTHPHNLFR